MKAKVQAKIIEPTEVAKHDSATLVFGLAVSAVFIAMLILNAIS